MSNIVDLRMEKAPPAKKIYRKRVSWDLGEKQALVMQIKTLSLMKPGATLTWYMNEAQRKLAWSPDRCREVKGPSEFKWLEQELRTSLSKDKTELEKLRRLKTPEPLPPPPPPPTAEEILIEMDDASLASIFFKRMFAKQDMILQELRHIKERPYQTYGSKGSNGQHTEDEPEVKLPIIAVIGPNTKQEKEIRSEFNDLAKLKFNNGDGRANRLPTCDHLICVSGWTSPEWRQSCKNQKKRNSKSVTMVMTKQVPDIMDAIMEAIFQYSLANTA